MIAHTVRPSALTIFCSRVYSTVIETQYAPSLCPTLQRACNASACASEWALLRIETCSAMLYPRYNTVLKYFRGSRLLRTDAPIVPYFRTKRSHCHHSIVVRGAWPRQSYLLGSRLYDTVQYSSMWPFYLRRRRYSTGSNLSII